MQFGERHLAVFGKQYLFIRTVTLSRPRVGDSYRLAGMRIFLLASPLMAGDGNAGWG